MFKDSPYKEELPITETAGETEIDRGLSLLIKEGILEIVPESLQRNITDYNITFRHLSSGAYLNYYVSERTEPTLISLRISVPPHEERTPKQNKEIAQTCREDLSKRDIGRYFED